MNIAIVLPIALIIGVTGIVMSILYLFLKFITKEDYPPGSLISILNIISILLFLWIGASYHLRVNINNVKQEIICNIEKVNIGKLYYQRIAWKNQQTGLENELNLNHTFYRVFEDGDQIKVIEYISGPYFGIYWNLPNKYELILQPRNNFNAPA